MKLEYHIEVEGKMHHIVVSPALDAAGGYHVMIDNYYKGQIVHSPFGLLPFIENTGNVLYSEDIQVIIDELSKEYLFLK